jgi:hypothetical protein
MPGGGGSSGSQGILLEYCIGCDGLQPHLGCSPLGFGEALGLCLPLAAATTNPNGLTQLIRVRVGGGAASPSCYLPQPPPLCAAGPRGVLPPYKRTPPYAIQIIHCTAIYSLPLTVTEPSNCWVTKGCLNCSHTINILFGKICPSI